MIFQLDWPRDVVEGLTEEARQKGLSLDVYVLRTVTQQKSNVQPMHDDAGKRRKREEAAASIRDLRKGNILGPDIAIRDLIEEGRRF